MSTLVYMKMLEQNPVKYDRGMRIITVGRIDRIKREIATAWIDPGHDVLEIGCGTGSLAALMTARGARVVGIDISDNMLAAARRNAPEAEFIHMTATEIGMLGEGRFDRIVATLSFSELSEDELDHVLSTSFVILKRSGRLVVADETPSTGWWKRTLARLVRWPLASLTFILTQNTTQALKMYDQRVERVGFRVVHRKVYLLGTLSLIVAEKS